MSSLCRELPNCQSTAGDRIADYMLYCDIRIEIMICFLPVLWNDFKKGLEDSIEVKICNAVSALISRSDLSGTLLTIFHHLCFAAFVMLTI